MENSIKINCSFCDVTYEILTEEEDRPQYCSYCGDMIDLKEEEDDNWDN